MVKEHSQVVVLLMGALDVAVTAGAWVACFYLRFHSGYFEAVEPTPPRMDYILDLLVVTLLLTLLVFGRLGLYRTRRTDSPAREVLDVLRACAAVWIIEVVISHFLHSAPMSRKLQGLFLVVWPTMMIFYRGSARMILRSFRRRGRNRRTVAIVGAGRLGQKLLHEIRRQRWTGYDVLYFVEDTRVGQEFLGVSVRGPVGDIERIIQSHPVDVVMVALPQERSAQLADVLDRLSGSLVDVNVVPDLLSYQFLTHRVRQLGSLPIVNLTHSPQSGHNVLLKRAFDIAGAAVALLVLSPLMLLIAMAILCAGRGGVFYRQRRASLGGREFDIIKFRSMVPDAEAADGAVWAARHDPRVTPIGRLLRKLSLDELPQLINVLRGDMSLVGPRPERPELIDRFSHQVPRYMLRHHVKAGITGWAQVRGYRGQTSLRKRIQYDLDYINRWSFGFDLYILLLTVLRGFVNPQD